MPRRETLLTPANAVTLSGLILTVIGAWHLNTTWGVLLTGFGRALDVVDGKIARLTHSASFFGAVFDATADKVGVFVIIAAEWHFEIAPKIVLLGIILQNAANAIAFIIARIKFLRFRVASKTGKHAMFAQNIALGCFALAGIIEQNVIHGGLRYIGYAMAIIGVVILGIPASYWYLRSALTGTEHKDY